MKRRDDFLIGPKEKAAEAIKEGKTEDALRYLDEVHNQFHRLHDAYGNTQDFFMGALAEIKGEEWLVEFDRKRVREFFYKGFQAYKDKSVEERVKGICDNMRAHFSEFHVEEDDEKFTVVLTGCNAGGRLLRDGISVRNKAVTKKETPWGFNKVGFPYYCIHATIFNEIFKELGLNMEIKWGKQYDDNGNKINEPCRYLIYK